MNASTITLVCLFGGLCAGGLRSLGLDGLFAVIWGLLSCPPVGLEAFKAMAAVAGMAGVSALALRPAAQVPLRLLALAGVCLLRPEPLPLGGASAGFGSGLVRRGLGLRVGGLWTGGRPARAGETMTACLRPTTTTRSSSRSRCSAPPSSPWPTPTAFGSARRVLWALVAFGSATFCCRRRGGLLAVLAAFALSLRRRGAGRALLRAGLIFSAGALAVTVLAVFIHGSSRASPQARKGAAFKRPRFGLPRSRWRASILCSGRPGQFRGGLPPP